MANVREQKIIHINSLGFKSARNLASNLIAKILFEDGLCGTFASFETFIQTRRQFDSNSCGVWLVAAICSYITGLPDILDRGNAFDICYNPVNHVSEGSEPQKKPDDYSMDFSIDEQLNNFTNAKFLIDVFFK